MGSSLIASCQCGYEKHVFLGAGRSNFETVCHFPHYCDDCKEVVSVDIFSDEIKCPNCKSTNVHTYEAKSKRIKDTFTDKMKAKLVGNKTYHSSEDEEFSWYGRNKDHVILKGMHHCPSCEDESLEFSLFAMVD